MGGELCLQAGDGVVDALSRILDLLLGMIDVGPAVRLRVGGQLRNVLLESIHIVSKRVARGS